jgi:hypothetical protein
VANATRSSHHDAGYMMLIVQSKNGGDEAFLSFSANEIYAMAYAEEGMLNTALYAFIMVLFVDTLVERVFDSVKEDNLMEVKMIFRLGMLA